MLTFAAPFCNSESGIKASKRLLRCSNLFWGGTRSGWTVQDRSHSCLHVSRPHDLSTLLRWVGWMGRYYYILHWSNNGTTGQSVKGQFSLLPAREQRPFHLSTPLVSLYQHQSLCLDLAVCCSLLPVFKERETTMLSSLHVRRRRLTIWAHSVGTLGTLTGRHSFRNPLPGRRPLKNLFQDNK